MLRKRKNRRYNETNDEEGDGERKFDINEQIKSVRFEQLKERHLQELNGDEITLKFIQRNGFEKPILVNKSNGLDLRVPPKTFLVKDVRNHVGLSRIIDVMDVKTQKNIEMSMKDWTKYYESKSRDRLLNVISLEFSHTPLDDLVQAPMIVRLLDWVDLVWPKFLKESQTESTNTINKMKYPKVQKYCLMSVKGSYTDFHIDFGGTSVWYHILRGKKIFWMVPPTELNLQIFEEWTLSGMQQDVFFGDTVEECFRVELCAGNTFFIPSGWIHAVYTLEDSLVFGGNFLHSFGIENQLKVSKIEDATKVPIKFRYPFYTEILWYVVQHYVYCLTEKDHLHRHELIAQAIKEKEEAEKAAKSHIKNNSIEIEDETTESEHYDSDINNSTEKKVTPRKKTKTPKRQSTSRMKKHKKEPPPPPTDDDETDIDSANEEKPETKPVTTCRMTKNSLLRLQYQVDEEEQQQSTKAASTKGDSPAKTVSGKKKQSAEPTSPPPSSSTPLQSSKQQQAISGTLNLADMMLSHESNLNGWSSGATGQSVWSNPNTDSNEPKKVHLTKFELNGLKVLVKHLSKLSGAKKNLPNLIRNSRALLDDCRKLIVEHENDDPELAISGKPITPELLREPKKTDMNELIGQFFKPIETTGDDDTTSSTKQTNKVSSPSSTSFIKSQVNDTSSGSHKMKSTSKTVSDGVLTSTKTDEKKQNNFTSTNDNVTKSPQKETKCLSPSKKLSTLTSSSSSSPPPRPKSPPTRPLSNNQYTSKTKNNNNLLMPGSFADLIAATSTEKKVFDVGGSDVSALFGVKDPISSKTSTSSAHKTNKKDKMSSIEDTKAGIKGSLSSASKLPLDVLTSSPSTSGTTGAGTGNPAKESLSPNFIDSSKPNQAQVQKRFINPSFKPQQQSKEKLIYASAPYISPVHTTDQPRSLNQYSWPTPVHHSQHQHQQHQHTHPSSQLPYTPKPPRAHSTNLSQTMSASQAPYIPDSRLINNQQGQINSLQDKPHKPESNKQIQPTTPTIDVHQAKISDQQKPHQQQQQQQASINIGSQEKNSSHKTEAQQTVASNELVNKNSSVDDKMQAEAKKQTKPRGPPKKSKEARQVIELLPDTRPAQVPVSVVVKAPASSSSQASSESSHQAQKPKNKRQKKAKETEQSSANALPQPAPAPIQTMAVNLQQHMRPQNQPTVICGLVRPPATSTAQQGVRMNPQSYMITRPLLFNTMPTFSSAQFQQMQRAPMPLFTTPVGSPLGLPLQQGARIVWATQPGNIRPNMPVLPVVSTSAKSMPTPATTATTMTKPANLRATTNAHQDNAALLSLATTALSTAPMASSPALSQLSNRITTPHAIMVSSTGAQPPMFAPGQQFLRPFVQSMPMAPFIGQTGASRPTGGQLVFARLPNQTSQPRYLITQPGFMQQHFQRPNVVTSQPTSTLAYAALKSPADNSKVMKAKKVKTS